MLVRSSSDPPLHLGRVLDFTDERISRDEVSALIPGAFSWKYGSSFPDKHSNSENFLSATSLFRLVWERCVLFLEDFLCLKPQMMMISNKTRTTPDAQEVTTMTMAFNLTLFSPCWCPDKWCLFWCFVESWKCWSRSERSEGLNSEEWSDEGKRSWGRSPKVGFKGLRGAGMFTSETKLMLMLAKEERLGCPWSLASIVSVKVCRE